MSTTWEAPQLHEPLAFQIPFLQQHILAQPLSHQLNEVLWPWQPQPQPWMKKLQNQTFLIFTCRIPHYYICKFSLLLVPQTFFYSFKAQATDRVYGLVPFLCSSRTQTIQAAFAAGGRIPRRNTNRTHSDALARAAATGETTQTKPLGGRQLRSGAVATQYNIFLKRKDASTGWSLEMVPVSQQAPGCVPNQILVRHLSGEQMATYSSILTWRIQWKEEPGRLQSMGPLESDTTQRLNHPHVQSGLLSRGYRLTKPYLGEFKCEPFKRRLPGSCSLVVYGHKPCWFSKLDVLRNRLSGTGFESQGYRVWGSNSAPQGEALGFLFTPDCGWLCWGWHLWGDYVPAVPV